jgi:TetR/AcrR family transcriptional regulator
MQTRDRIMEAAEQLFGDVGFDATSTRMISESSSTNKALIHYHFRSKEGLFLAVLDRYFEVLSSKLQGAINIDGPITARLLNLISVYMDFLEENINYIRIVQREIMGGKNMERVIKHMGPIFEIILKVMADSYPRAQSGNFRVEQLTISFYGMVITYFTCSDVIKEFLHGDPMSKESIQERKNHLLAMAQIILKVLEE